MFRLKTNESELINANDGYANLMWAQVSPSRDVTLENFQNGSIHFKFDVAGEKWWIPNRSYVRIRARLKVVQGANVFRDLQYVDGVAPNMFAASNLFQSMEFRINDKTVSRVNDHVAQIESLETRMYKPKAWLDSTGKQSLMSTAHLHDRILDTATDCRAASKLGLRSMWGVPGAGFGRPLDFLHINTNQVAFVAATRQIVFTANGGREIPDLSVYFSLGEKIYIADGADKIVTVIGYAVNNTALVVAETLTGVGAANLVAQVRKSDFGTALDVDTTHKSQYVELTWKPCLSVFKISHALPTGKYELVLTPHSELLYKRMFIESLVGKNADVFTGSGAPLAADAGKIGIDIENMYFYCAQVDGQRIDDYTYLLDLEETSCQPELIRSGTGLNQQMTFMVPPSTFALTMAIQDNRAGSSTSSDYSATKFKVNAGHSEELNITRFYINYANRNRPQPDADPEHGFGKDYTVQRYIESLIESALYFDVGGAETLEEWHERGAYYHFQWPKDGADRSQRVTVSLANSQAYTVDANVLLFSHYRQVARVRIENGMVMDIQIGEY